MNVSVLASVALLCFLSAVVQCSDRSDGKALDYRYIMLQTINCANKGIDSFATCAKAAVRASDFPYDTSKVINGCANLVKDAANEEIQGPKAICVILKKLLNNNLNITDPNLKIKDIEKNTKAKEYFQCIQKQISSNLKGVKTYDEAITRSDDKIRSCAAKIKK